MKIAIHAADLDHGRIDGTRVYILNLLKQLGKAAPADDFLIYHKTSFNPQLAPPDFANYRVKALGKFLAWTHTRFAWEIFKSKPQVLWIPLHNLSWFRRKSLKTVVTIHDLAFKFFPEYFTKKDLFKLNLLAGHAIKGADRIIAISNSTKKDILKFYPEIKEEKIVVVHHGFDAELFSHRYSEKETLQILSKFKIFAPSLSSGQNSKFILYVGAIQPRKNLEILIEAFEKNKSANPDLKLVLAGEKAWMWEGVVKRIERSFAKKDIIITGKVPFADLPILYQKASAFIFPSLYEGFGIPVLEAFASGTPVILANNSSLPEVAGQAALYFEGNDSEELAAKLKNLLESPILQAEMKARGTERLKEFSWEKCARQTLDNITKW